MLKPYDPKKSIWVPDGQGGFKEALLENDDGTKAHCMVGHEVSAFLQYDNICLQKYVFLSLEKSVQVC